MIVQLLPMLNMAAGSLSVGIVGVRRRYPGRGTREQAGFIVRINRRGEVRRGRRLHRAAPQLRRIPRELVHLALQLMPVEDGGDTVSVRCAVIIVETPHQTKEKQEPGEGAEGLEDDRGGALVGAMGMSVDE